MSGCRGGWGLPVHTLWLRSKHAQPALSQGGADRGLVPCLRARWGKFMKKNKEERARQTCCLLFCWNMFSDSNTVKLHTNVEKGYNSFPRKVLEQCWLLLSIILNPNLTILGDFSTIYTGFVFPAAWTLLEYFTIICGFYFSCLNANKYMMTGEWMWNRVDLKVMNVALY